MVLQNELKIITNIIKASPAEIIIALPYLEKSRELNILIIVPGQKAEKNYERWAALEQDLNSNILIKQKVKIIVEHIGFFNQMLQMGRLFYLEAHEKGEILYDSGELKIKTLIKKSGLNGEDRLKKSKKYFKLKLKKSERFFKNYKTQIQDYEKIPRKIKGSGQLKKECLNNAVFNLHQMAESLFSSIVLILAGHSPKTHDLKELEKLAINLDPRFEKIFIRKTKQQKNIFKLFQKAYVESRYSEDYKVTKKQIGILESQVNTLKIMTEEICEEKLKKTQNELRNNFGNYIFELKLLKNDI